jgi:hypothetical protein
VASDVFSPGSVWASVDPNRPVVLTVRSRQGRDFEATWINNKSRIRQVIRGEVGDSTVAWRNTDVRPIEEPQGKTPAKKAPAKVPAKAPAKAPAKVPAKGQPAVKETHGSIKGNEIHFNVSNGDSFVLRRK